VYKRFFAGLSILVSIVLGPAVLSSIALAIEPDGRVAFRVSWPEVKEGDTPRLRLTMTAVTDLADARLVAKIPDGVGLAARGANGVTAVPDDGVEIGDVAFLGATLWTDFRLNGDPVLAEVAAQTGMTDFRRIRVTPSYRRFRPRDARRIHAQSLEWLAQETSKARGRKIIVVTHHAPSPQSVPAGFQKDQLNPAYASNLEPFIAECGAALWIHGHIHHRADFNVGTTRIVANPRGYPTEPHSGFDPSFVLEV
jgi:hypothetical protein